VLPLGIVTSPLQHTPIHCRSLQNVHRASLILLYWGQEDAAHESAVGGGCSHWSTSR
jgi:hypothetical protein